MTKPIDLASEVRALQDTIQQAVQEKARAEATRERAQMKLDSTLERLRTVFKVSSLEEAQTLLHELESALQKHIQVAQDALSEVDK